MGEQRFLRIEERLRDAERRVGILERKRLASAQSFAGLQLGFPVDEGIQTACCSNRIPRKVWYHDYGTNPQTDREMTYAGGVWFVEFSGGNLVRDELVCDSGWKFKRYLNGTLVSTLPVINATCDPLSLVFGETIEINLEPT